jgi:hypothetical protein
MADATRRSGGDARIGGLTGGGPAIDTSEVDRE